MAIQDNDAPTSLAAAAQPFNQNQNTQQQQTPQPQPMGGGLLSFMRLGASIGLSRAPASEVLTKAMTLMTEVVKKSNFKEKHDVTLIPCDNTKETNLAFSSVIVCSRLVGIPQAGVAYHVLVLEDSGEPLPVRNESERGEQYEVLRASSDAFNGVYMASVMELIGKAFPNMPAYGTDAQVIPRGNLYDKEDAVASPVVNAMLANATCLEAKAPGHVALNLKEMSPDTSLTVRLSFNGSTRTDYCGLPVRSDIQLVMSAASISRDPNKQNPNNQDRTKEITKVAGYIDPVWVYDPNKAHGLVPGQPNQKFAARCVLTYLECVADMSLPAQLLALVTAMNLRENNNWYPYFMPRPPAINSTKIDKRDIGAINIEGNMFNEMGNQGFGTFVETDPRKFTSTDLARLLYNSFIDGLHYTLRVNECGSDTWFTSIFAGCASANPGAIAALLKAANTLSGGNFSTIYGTNGENPVMVNYDRELAGHYIDADGKKCDIAEIDYLAVMNLAGKTDPTVGAAWSNTYTDLTKPLAYRLYKRKQMIDQLTGNSAVYTGFHRMITFTNKFLDALSQSCRGIIDMRTINPTPLSEYFAQRSNASWVQSGQVSNTPTGLFNQGGYTGPADNRYQGDQTRNTWF